MKQLKQKLLQRAIKEHSKIQLCSDKSFDECFTQEKGKLYFWFNNEDGNTHVISEDIL